jgi:pyruvate-formate lyase-activating enzyme
VEIAVPHLEKAPRAVVSFGQGCEGEPLTQAGLLEKAILEIRRRTAKGTINLNSNASRPEKIARLFEAGLDSIRVSLNSARQEAYRAYFRPRGYTLDDVRESLRTARRLGRFASINYFVFPGLTDDPGEARAFEKLCAEVRPDLIQWRNMNLDPEWYWETVGPFSEGDPLGIPDVMTRLRKKLPALRYGYYNPPLRGSRAYGPGMAKKP